MFTTVKESAEKVTSLVDLSATGRALSADSSTAADSPQHTARKSGEPD